MSVLLRYQVNAPHIVHEIFDDTEAAIINLKNGNYYSLDHAGAELWQLLSEGATVSQMAAALQTVYEGTASALQEAARHFIATLEAEDLITARPADESAAPLTLVLPLPANGTKRPFTPPVLERYNDMQELLLLDPIHEVEEIAGWPHRIEAAG